MQRMRRGVSKKSEEEHADNNRPRSYILMRNKESVQ